MLKFKHTYILLIFIAGMFSCRQTKYVPEGKHLLKKNKIEIVGDKIPKDDVSSIIRQHPNYKRFGVKWKLMAFNLIDSTKVADKRLEKNKKIRLKNADRIAKQKRINESRVEKALKKGKSHYTEKIIPLKDTLEPRKFFREWYKYKIGRPPVVFDSIPFNKSLEQLEVFLRKKGYYYGGVSGNVNFRNNKKCVVTYTIETGEQYKIDSIYIIEDNKLVREKYIDFLSDDGNSMLDRPFDADLLDNHRYRVAKHMRNNGIYGFSTSHIMFHVDTNMSTMRVKMGVQFSDRVMISEEDKDSVVRVKHQEAFVSNVYFHVADTMNFIGDFSARVQELGLTVMDGQFIRTLDTTYFTRYKNKETGGIDISRMAIFMHNGKLMVKPKILEGQNYLEIDSKYSERHLEKTYLSLLQLDLFEIVKTELNEQEDLGCLDAHYYLVPAKKQSFSFEPRATNSNGFLGVAATVNYVNKNLFRGAEKLTLSFSGGFESQPPVFDKTIDGDKIQSAGRSFNTFEVGPSSQLELPGLFPLRVSDFSKKLRPKTIISAAYNFQRRDDFTRGTFQMGYLWKFFVSKTMIFQSGFPGASVVKFVGIENTPEFEAKLNSLNDLFLINAYSDQFIWQDWKLTFEYNIREREHRKGDAQVYFKASFDPAGNLFSLFKKFQDTTETGQRAMFGIGYSQFSRLDTELIFSEPLKKDKSINFKLDLGAGIPYGNTTTSMPYDYSFFAGGANDNRGWRARALGPGAYKYYLDTNRTATQIGDIGLSASAEYRFSISSLFKGAVFVDAGNIWTIFQDDNRDGGKISGSWYKEIAVAAGVGLRMDLDFFIIRVDLGMPIMNPALPQGARWVFQSRQPYYDEGKAVFGDPYYKELMPLPFIPTLHFGIGYPF